MAGKIRRDYWAKASAGALLGLGLALSLVGLYAYLGPGGIDAPTARYSLMRHLEAFVWILVFGFSFLFRSGWGAWAWLGAANVIAFAGLFACRFYFFA